MFTPNTIHYDKKKSPVFILGYNLPPKIRRIFRIMYQLIVENDKN